jgi:c-di-GMP-binding flagellar brake protein YcgR
MDEKRRFQRVELSVPVNYEISNKGNAKNLSEGGLCIVTEKPLAYGHDLTIMFSLPGDSHLNIKSFAKVVWSKTGTENSYECGVQFWDISPHYKKHIQAFIKKHSGPADDHKR